MSVDMRLTLAGNAAAALLTKAARLSVFTVFERSLYLRTDEGALFCVGSPALAPGPIMALCDFWFEPDDLPRTGETFARRGERLASARHAFVFEGMRVWSPPPFPEPDFARLRSALERLARALPGQIPENGLAPLLPGLLSGSAPGFFLHFASSGPVEAMLRREGWKGLLHMLNWLEGDPDKASALEAGVQALLGLGPGLTPSGDDALAGMLLALSALRSSGQQNALGACVARHAAQATNAVSRAHLEQAARGLGAAPIHEGINVLLTDDADFSGLFTNLRSIGHSSGWDTFTGIVLALHGAIRNAQALSGMPEGATPSGREARRGA